MCGDTPVESILPGTCVMVREGSLIAPERFTWGLQYMIHAFILGGDGARIVLLTNALGYWEWIDLQNTMPVRDEHTARKIANEHKIRDI